MSRYSWKDCPSIVTLSGYLRENKQHGFSIVLLDGAPAIHCQPGVTPAEKERWDVLNRAWDLLRAADQDLMHCITNNMIKIPGHPGWR